MSKGPIIAVDFDGTIVEHDFPRIGRPIPGAIEYLCKFQKAGAKLTLWTMRSGETLQAAVNYLYDDPNHARGPWKLQPFFGINENPEQGSWTSSPKAYAHMYIDDAAFGCPLIWQGGRPFVDWSKVGPSVLEWIKDYSK